VQLLAKGVDGPSLTFQNCTFVETATHGRAPVQPSPGEHDFYYAPISLQPSPWGAQYEAWAWPYGGLVMAGVVIRQTTVPAAKATPWLRLEGPAGASDPAALRLANISITGVNVFTNSAPLATRAPAELSWGPKKYLLLCEVFPV
jgi:hypothetical protein